jgi:hypothetical protein
LLGKIPRILMPRNLGRCAVNALAAGYEPPWRRDADGTLPQTPNPGASSHATSIGIR